MALPDWSRNEKAHVVEWLAGRLLVMRVGELRSIEDWENLSRRFFHAIEASPGAVVACADYRCLQVMNDTTTTAVVRDLRRANPKVFRSALLLPRGAASVRLQMDRLLREAGNPGRRICGDPAEAKAWLGVELEARERAALDGFLASVDC